MREGNPEVGDRVRVRATGHVGTVEYLENHQFDVSPTVVGVRYDSVIDVPWTLQGGSRREGDEFSISEIEVMAKKTRLRHIREAFTYHGEGRQEDMSLDLDDPDKYLLVQSSPRDNEPWYVLLGSLQDAAEYIRCDYPPWDFESLIDLDTGEEFNLVTEYSFTPARKEVTA